MQHPPGSRERSRRRRSRREIAPQVALAMVLAAALAIATAASPAVANWDWPVRNPPSVRDPAPLVGRLATDGAVATQPQLQYLDVYDRSLSGREANRPALDTAVRSATDRYLGECPPRLAHMLIPGARFRQVRLVAAPTNMSVKVPSLYDPELPRCFGALSRLATSPLIHANAFVISYKASEVENTRLFSRVQRSVIALTLYLRSLPRPANQARLLDVRIRVLRPDHAKFWAGWLFQTLDYGVADRVDLKLSYIAGARFAAAFRAALHTQVRAPLSLALKIEHLRCVDRRNYYDSSTAKRDRRLPQVRKARPDAEARDVRMWTRTVRVLSDELPQDHALDEVRLTVSPFSRAWEYPDAVAAIVETQNLAAPFIGIFDVPPSAVPLLTAAIANRTERLRQDPGERRARLPGGGAEVATEIPAPYGAGISVELAEADGPLWSSLVDAIANLSAVRPVHMLEIDLVRLPEIDPESHHIVWPFSEASLKLTQAVSRLLSLYGASLRSLTLGVEMLSHFIGPDRLQLMAGLFKAIRDPGRTPSLRTVRLGGLDTGFASLAALVLLAERTKPLESLTAAFMPFHKYTSDISPPEPGGLRVAFDRQLTVDEQRTHPTVRRVLWDISRGIPHWMPDERSRAFVANGRLVVHNIASPLRPDDEGCGETFNRLAGFRSLNPLHERAGEPVSVSLLRLSDDRGASRRGQFGFYLRSIS